VRLYDHLFTRENPDEAEDFLESINTESLQVLEGARVEPSLRDAVPGDRFQFLRQGYFCVDYDSSTERLIFNRTATLRDTWAKIEKAQGRRRA
jgi:glutaminyl-tRNA synthetase